MSLPSSEKWRPVPDWEGYYEVGDHGRVRSLDRMVDNGSGKFWLRPGQFLTRSRNPLSGRHTVRFTAEGRRWTPYVYLLVLTAFVGPRPPDLVACHNDGDCGNDRLDNLRWDTPSENNRDMVRHGTHHNAKKTRCNRGHALIVPNLVPSLIGRCRQCLACNRAKWNARQERGRGIEIDFQSVSDRHYARIMEEKPCPAT